MHLLEWKKPYKKSGILPDFLLYKTCQESSVKSYEIIKTIWQKSITGDGWPPLVQAILLIIVLKQHHTIYGILLCYPLACSFPAMLLRIARKYTKYLRRF